MDAQDSKRRSVSLKRQLSHQHYAPTIPIPSPPPLTEESAYPPSSSRTPCFRKTTEQPKQGLHDHHISLDDQSCLAEGRSQGIRPPIPLRQLCPVTTEIPLTDCPFEGTIPEEFRWQPVRPQRRQPAGQLVARRDAHWIRRRWQWLAGGRVSTHTRSDIQPCLSQSIHPHRPLAVDTRALATALRRASRRSSTLTLIFWLMCEDHPHLRPDHAHLVAWSRAQQPAEAEAHQCGQHECVLHDGKAMAVAKVDLRCGHGFPLERRRAGTRARTTTKCSTRRAQG